MEAHIIPRTTPIDPKTFIIPARSTKKEVDYTLIRVAAILPTYRPSEITERLVRDLVRFNQHLLVYVVDDCTPSSCAESHAVLARIAECNERVRLLKTPENKLKAGALNYALSTMAGEGEVPDVVLTLDDDVIIERETVRNLVTTLMSDERLGAACSQCRVLNKNTNILTRLQGLEYVGFNAIRLADHGFLRGPLVMHGMLTAFRGEALRAVGGFMEEHLIEDYEVTARLKSRGWNVVSALDARAWTVVPDRLSKLWRQRTRWSYGGLTVVARASRASSVFQDILGHSVFLSMIVMLVALSFFRDVGTIPLMIAYWVIALSLIQLIVWYVFQLWLMLGYREKDAYDWILRATLIPEFLYSYIMTTALLGSYVFFSFNTLKGYVAYMRGTTPLLDWMTMFFQRCGFAEHRWATRTSL